MVFNTKYNIGDTVWIITDARENIKTSYVCPVCCGTGHMKVFGKKCDAAIMNGKYKCVDGFLCPTEIVRVPAAVEVLNIFISTENGSTEIEYEIRNDNLSIYRTCLENNIFATAEEAAASLTVRTVKSTTSCSRKQDC